MTAKRIAKSPGSIEVLIQCSGDRASSLRHALSALGYQHISLALSYEEALGVANARDFDLILFSASGDANTQMLTSEFLNQLMELCPQALLVAILIRPSLDDIFQALRNGARGGLITPFTPQTVEEVLQLANSDFEISLKVLEDPNRERSLARMVLDALDKLAECLRKVNWSMEEDLVIGSPEFRAVQDTCLHFSDTMRCAKLCCRQDKLTTELVQEAVNRANRQHRFRRARILLDLKHSDG